MRKLTWLLIATYLASYTVHLWSVASPTASFVLRDGLWIALLAIGLVAWQATTGNDPIPGKQSAFSPASLAATQRRLTATGTLFVGTGAICLIVGALIPFGLSASIALQTATMLRGLGWAMVAIALVLPSAWRHQRHLPLENSAASIAAPAHRIQPAAPVASHGLALVVLLVIGVGLRLLLLDQYPATCVGRECDIALALNGAVPTTVPAAALLQFIARLAPDTLQGVRWGVTAIALVIPLFFYLALRRITISGAAFIGALLFTLTPWFATLDGSTLATLILLLWGCMALWLIVEALSRHDPRWSLAAGIAFGMIRGDLLTYFAILFWLLLLAFLSLLMQSQRQSGQRVDWRQEGLLVFVGYFCALLPALTLVPLQPAAWGASFATAATNAFEGNSFLYTLFQQGLLTERYWQLAPPLAMPLSVLTLLGLGLYWRRLRELPYLWIGSGLLIFGLLFYASASESLLAFFFLLMLVTATLMVGNLLVAIIRQWQPLLSATNLTALATLCLFVLAISPLWASLSQSQTGRSRETLVVEQLMIEQIAALRVHAPERTIFVPDTLLKNPSARLRLGDEALATLQPLSNLLNALYSTDAPHTTTYLIPPTAQPYLTLLQRMQPGATVSQQIDPVSGEWRFSEVTVQQADLIAQQGLMGVAWHNGGDGAGTPQMLPALGPIEFTDSTLTLAQPFSVQWSGTLRVAMPGSYLITIDPLPAESSWLAPEADRPILTMQLDSRLILDTSLGLWTQELALAKGFYQLSISYRTVQTDTPSAPIAPFAIRWQRPDGVEEIIPRTALSNLPLPSFGLIGEYFWGKGVAGEPFDIRKDLFVGALAERSQPYTIRWRGQLAAPRSGEYLISTLSAPGSLTQIALDGMPLIDTGLITSAPSADGDTASDPASHTLYGEGTIYLTRGWHTIELIHQPDDAQTPLQLFWQPPGSAPAMLDADYFAPTTTPLAEGDRTFPSAPPLINGGDAYAFALSYGTEYWQPQRQIPPGYLPQLLLDLQWQVGRCGSGDTDLDQPHGVAISGVRGLIYVADTANRRVVEYTQTGSVSRIYTSPDWQEPFAVALIDDGFPVVLDATTQLLYDLNPATGVVTTRPQRASFYRPRGLAVDNSGNLLVADTGGGRIVQLSPAGDELRAFGGQGTAIGRGQPTGVAGAAGTLWAIAPEDGRLWQLNSGGSITAIERTNTLNGPHVAALPTGQLFISDPARRSVLYVAATGEPLAQVNVSNLVAPTGIAAATVDDRLYLALADSGNCALAMWGAPVARLPQPTP